MNAVYRISFWELKYPRGEVGVVIAPFLDDELYILIAENGEHPPVTVVIGLNRSPAKGVIAYPCEMCT
jgi:hypothetical protein